MNRLSLCYYDGRHYFVSEIAEVHKLFLLSLFIPMIAFPMEAFWKIIEILPGNSYEFGRWKLTTPRNNYLLCFIEDSECQNYYVQAPLTVNGKKFKSGYLYLPKEGDWRKNFSVHNLMTASQKKLIYDLYPSDLILPKKSQIILFDGAPHIKVQLVKDIDFHEVVLKSGDYIVLGEKKGYQKTRSVLYKKFQFSNERPIELILDKEGKLIGQKGILGGHHPTKNYVLKRGSMVTVWSSGSTEGGRLLSNVVMFGTLVPKNSEIIESKFINRKNVIVRIAEDSSIGNEYIPKNSTIEIKNGAVSSVKFPRKTNFLGFKTDHVTFWPRGAPQNIKLLERQKYRDWELMPGFLLLDPKGFVIEGFFTPGQRISSIVTPEGEGTFVSFYRKDVLRRIAPGGNFDYDGYYYGKGSVLDFDTKGKLDPGAEYLKWGKGVRDSIPRIKIRIRVHPASKVFPFEMVDKYYIASQKFDKGDQVFSYDDDKALLEAMFVEDRKIDRHLYQKNTRIWLYYHTGSVKSGVLVKDLLVANRLMCKKGMRVEFDVEEEISGCCENTGEMTCGKKNTFVKDKK